MWQWGVIHRLWTLSGCHTSTYSTWQRPVSVTINCVQERCWFLPAFAFIKHSKHQHIFSVKQLLHPIFLQASYGRKQEMNQMKVKIKQLTSIKRHPDLFHELAACVSCIWPQKACFQDVLEVNWALGIGAGWELWRQKASSIHKTDSEQGASVHVSSKLLW